MADVIAEIHDFWFGELDSNGLCVDDKHPLWFTANKATDDYCREHFGASLALAQRGQLHQWAETDRGLIALVVLLDQFSRNIYRGTPQAFAQDTAGLNLALESIGSGRHEHLPLIQRVFLYLPLEHCEDLSVQDSCVALFENLTTLTDHPQFTGFTRYAIAHRNVIAQFGRFPHRNRILGRVSSTEELDYLQVHGGF
jgi:uncharacterized protein (DUF924 family)